MTWVTIFGMAVITFLNRYAFFAEGLKFDLSKRMLRFLSFSSYSILTAIWVPIVFQFELSQGFSQNGYDYLLATGLATFLALLKVPSIVIVIVSSVAFFLLRAFVFSTG